MAVTQLFVHLKNKKQNKSRQVIYLPVKGSANYGSRTKPGPVFLNKVLLGHPYAYVLSTAALVLEG